MQKYVTANLKASFSEELLCHMFQKFLFFVPDDIKTFSVAKLYEWLEEFLQRSTQCTGGFYRKNVKSGDRIENLTKAIFFLHCLISNLMTVRFYYHFVDEKIKNPYSEMCDQLRSVIRLIDNMQREHSKGGISRHAESILVDYIIEKSFPKTAKLIFYPSRKLCLCCHALLITLKVVMKKIDFYEASNLEFANWRGPSLISQIYPLFEAHEKGFWGLFDEIKEILKETTKYTDELGHIKKKKYVSMYRVPFIKSLVGDIFYEDLKNFKHL